MKAIIDAQLPASLVAILRELGVDAMHVDELPRGDETPDSDISDYADQHNLIEITKDSDFFHSHMALGKPKRLFLIGTGILRTVSFLNLSEQIIYFLPIA